MNNWETPELDNTVADKTVFRSNETSMNNTVVKSVVTKPPSDGDSLLCMNENSAPNQVPITRHCLLDNRKTVDYSLCKQEFY